MDSQRRARVNEKAREDVGTEMSTTLNPPRRAFREPSRRAAHLGRAALFGEPAAAPNGEHGARAGGQETRRTVSRLVG